MNCGLVLASFFLAVGSAGEFQPAVAAIKIDGVLDPGYGSPLVVQTTKTAVGDNTLTSIDMANGSELDAAYATISNGVLYLFLSGNLAYEPSPEPPAYGGWVNVFIDSKPGGQNVLGSNNPVIPMSVADPAGVEHLDTNTMAGLEFDSGFAADYWLGCFATGSPNIPPVHVAYAELPTSGGGTGLYLGSAPPGGPGTLTGGTNPGGIMAAMNNSNTAGVTAGCDAGSGAGVTTGLELAIPLSMIGGPTGCIAVCAFVADSYLQSVSNQVLGPLSPGTCNLGPLNAVNFAAIPGDQFFTICSLATQARPTTWGRLKLLYR